MRFYIYAKIPHDLLENMAPGDWDVVSVYHLRYAMETRKVELAEKIAGFDHEGDDFQNAFEFLGNPHKLWSSEDIFDKRLTLKLAFVKPLTYHRKEGF